ncbi:hypothetical protein DFR31_1377 [Alkalispirillum mobile]|uniref:Uncharacterized protein n=1 Tax=Alkalispirillum mobile TaxID=85925 RepID=A0A498CAA9_9GAMM|nr:hypothetical protein [Alkalispirillum mobile]RLK51436.1 hypothetical protein DFR31_1377 [Alkalispirillum mobile]
MKLRYWHGLVALAVVGAVAVLGLQAWADREGRLALEEALEGLPAEWSADYDRVAVNLWNQRLHVFDLTVAHEGEQPLRVDELIVVDVDREHSPPHHLRVRAVGLHADPADGWPVPAADWSDDSAEWVFAYRYDPEAQALQVDEFRLNIPGRGWAVGRLHLTRFDLGETLRTHALELPEFEVAGLNLRYRDQGFFRALADESQAEALIPMVQGWAGRFGEPFFMETAEAVTVFLRDPVGLELRARPTEPVPLLDLVAMAMVTPEAIPARLDAQVRVVRD